MSSISYHPPTAPAKETENPPRRPELTNEQFNKLSSLIAHLNGADFSLPLTVKDVKAAQKLRLKKYGSKPEQWSGLPVSSGDKNEVLQPLNDVEKCFLSNEQCQRFLRAVKWDLPSAFNRAEETIVWRREFEVEKINEHPEMIEEEGKTGKEIIMGWDLQRRPCLYMFPYRQNTNTLDRQIQFVVWCLERTVDMMGPEVENLCLLIDFGTGEKGGGGQPTSLGQARKVLTILQTYYCERLGRALCIRIPSLFYGFYRLVSPFVDPVTKDKIRFNPDCRTLVPASQLDKLAFGGDSNFEFKHEEYFPYIHKAAKQRREENLARWRQFGGGKCGLSEFIIKGGMENERTSGDLPRDLPDGASAQATNGTASTAGTSVKPQQTDSDSTNASTPALTPAISQSVATSGQNSPTSSEAVAGKASDDAHHSYERNEEAVGGQKLGVNGDGGRERVNSSDSFVTSPEVNSPPVESKVAQNVVGNGSSSVGTLDTGVAGLVIK